MILTQTGDNIELITQSEQIYLHQFKSKANYPYPNFEMICCLNK